MNIVSRNNISERPKAIFAWELGYGLGHIGVVTPIAKRMHQGGIDCIIAGYLDKNAAAVAPKFAKIIQPPQLLTLQRNAATYSELLINAGLHNPIAAMGAVQAWINIFEQHTPAILVADLAPFAILAARILKLPTVIVGSTFNLPPPIAPQPFLRTWEGNINSLPLQQIEAMALRGINTILTMKRCTPVSAVFQMYDHATAVMSGLQSLDHFDRDQLIQPITYCGAIRISERGMQQVWPQGEGRKVFVHLKRTNSNTQAILKVLDDLGCRVIAFIPDGASYTSRNVVISNKPFNLESVAADVDLAICQGNLSTSLFFIERRNFVLSSPETLEQALTARKLRKSKLGETLHHAASDSMVRDAILKAFNAKSNILADQLPKPEEAIESIFKLVSEKMRMNN